MSHFSNNSSFHLDPETEALLVPYRTEIEAAGSSPFGETTVTLDYEQCRVAECNTGEYQSLSTSGYLV